MKLIEKEASQALLHVSVTNVVMDSLFGRIYFYHNVKLHI
jgi:hypothetical protein